MYAELRFISTCNKSKEEHKKFLFWQEFTTFFCLFETAFLCSFVAVLELNLQLFNFKCHYQITSSLNEYLMYFGVKKKMSTTKGFRLRIAAPTERPLTCPLTDDGEVQYRKRKHTFLVMVEVDTTQACEVASKSSVSARLWFLSWMPIRTEEMCRP